MIRTSLWMCALGLSVAGCGGSTPPNAANITSPSGMAADQARYDSIKVNPLWKNDVQPVTLALVKDKLDYPKTADFKGAVHYEADYDKDRQVTELRVYGNAQSEGPYGNVSKQGWYAIWFKPGDIRKPSAIQSDWHIDGLQILSEQFPD